VRRLLVLTVAWRVTRPGPLGPGMSSGGGRPDHFPSNSHVILLRSDETASAAQRFRKANNTGYRALIIG